MTGILLLHLVFIQQGTNPVSVDTTALQSRSADTCWVWIKTSNSNEYNKEGCVKDTSNGKEVKKVFNGMIWVDSKTDSFIIDGSIDTIYVLYYPEGDERYSIRDTNGILITFGNTIPNSYSANMSLFSFVNCKGDTIFGVILRVIIPKYDPTQTFYRAIGVNSDFLGIYIPQKKIVVEEAKLIRIRLEPEQ